MSWFGKAPEKCGECEKLRLEFGELRATVTELADKVYHWMKRHEARATAAAARETSAITEEAAADSPRVAALMRRRNALTGNSDH